LESAAVVVPEFASVVEFEPRAFRAQALSVASVPEQTAYTPLPTARKSRGERGEQFLERRHCGGGGSVFLGMLLDFTPTMTFGLSF
jgi:hypothetical protein